MKARDTKPVPPVTLAQALALGARYGLVETLQLLGATS